RCGARKRLCPLLFAGDRPAALLGYHTAARILPGCLDRDQRRGGRHLARRPLRPDLDEGNSYARRFQPGVDRFRLAPVLEGTVMDCGTGPGRRRHGDWGLLLRRTPGSFPPTLLRWALPGKRKQWRIFAG